MGLSPNELERRANETGDISIFTPDDGVDYVFVSYKSDDWEIVLNKIVRQLADFGLRVYYDKNFEKNNNSWLDNMKRAISSKRCKAVICFISKKYISSYACATELLYTQTREANVKRNYNILPIIPIIISSESLEQIIQSTNGQKIKFNSGEEKDLYKKFCESTRDNVYNKNEELKEFIKDVIPVIDKDNLDDDYNSLLISKILSKSQNHRNFRENQNDWYKMLIETITNVSQNVFEMNENIEIQEKENENEKGNDNDNVETVKKANSLTEAEQIVDDKRETAEIKKCISTDYFETHKNDKDLIENEQKALKFYDEFKSKFSPEKLKELSGLTLLRSIFLNDEGNQTNICSLFEYNKDYIQFGSIKGGTALKHIIYYSAKENSWMTGKPPVTYNKLTEQEAIELGTKIRDNIVKACEIIDSYKGKLSSEEAYEQMYNEIDTQADGIHKVLFVKKYFHMMYKDLFPCMFSTGYLRKISNTFGFGNNLDETEIIAKIEMEKNKYNISNYLFSLIIYKFFDETIGTSRSESKILSN